MGRTGSSWAKIGGFYLIFYSFLAAWFAVMLSIFFTTLRTDDLPQYTPGDETSLLTTVAMAYRPQAKPSNIESTLIWYDMDYVPNPEKDDPEKDHWIKNLNDTFAEYGKISKAVWYVPCTDAKPRNDTAGQVCQFKAEEEFGLCGPQDRWGYDSGNPCVLLKLNKMIGWKPEPYETEEEINKDKDLSPREKNLLSKSMQKTGAQKRIFVLCDGKYAPDRHLMGNVEMYPDGFNSVYFPYNNEKGYQAPMVAVRFAGIAKNVVVNIECKAYAKNLKPARETRTAMIDFELLLDTKKPNATRVSIN